MSSSSIQWRSKKNHTFTFGVSVAMLLLVWLVNLDSLSFTPINSVLSLSFKTTDNSTTQIDGSIESSTPPDVLWNLTNWTRTLFYVEDICHSSHRWFYRSKGSDPTEKQQQHQPDVLFKFYSQKVMNVPSAYQHEYKFEHVPENATSHCTTSPITNHLVFFSMYNEMLGEFYDRGLYHLWRLSQHFDWVSTAQLYLHLYTPNRHALDSHHIFTSPFRNHPLLDFTTLLDETPCTCLPRLIFFGYDAQPHQTNESETVVVIEPSSDPFPPKTNVGGMEHQEFRNFLRHTMVETNDAVQTDVEILRQSIFQKYQIPIALQSKYKIVGLAQRKLRRRWRNLDDILQNVTLRNVLYQNNILLVEANVETITSSSYRQIVNHGALDALIGIHGAQLTEAIWMKAGSWVVELLPYIPEGIMWGLWTKQTDSATPLGWIFDNTDLNHVGYPLQRDNAPYCYDEESDPLDCWRIHRNPWDERDFVLAPETLERIVKALLVGELDTCHDYRDRAAHALVLYNINCAVEIGGAVETHQYFWDQDMLQGNATAIRDLPESAGDNRTMNLL